MFHKQKTYTEYHSDDEYAIDDQPNSAVDSSLTELSDTAICELYLKYVNNTNAKSLSAPDVAYLINRFLTIQNSNEISDQYSQSVVFATRRVAIDFEATKVNLTVSNPPLTTVINDMKWEATTRTTAPTAQELRGVQDLYRECGITKKVIEEEEEIEVVETPSAFTATITFNDGDGDVITETTTSEQQYTLEENEEYLLKLIHDHDAEQDVFTHARIPQQPDVTYTLDAMCSDDVSLKLRRRHILARIVESYVRYDRNGNVIRQTVTQPHKSVGEFYNHESLRAIAAFCHKSFEGVLHMEPSEIIQSILGLKGHEFNTIWNMVISPSSFSVFNNSERCDKINLRYLPTGGRLQLASEKTHVDTCQEYASLLPLLNGTKGWSDLTRSFLFGVNVPKGICKAMKRLMDTRLPSEGKLVINVIKGGRVYCTALANACSGRDVLINDVSVNSAIYPRGLVTYGADGITDVVGVVLISGRLVRTRNLKQITLNFATPLAAQMSKKAYDYSMNVAQTFQKFASDMKAYIRGGSYQCYVNTVVAHKLGNVHVSAFADKGFMMFRSNEDGFKPDTAIRMSLTIARFALAYPYHLVPRSAFAVRVNGKIVRFEYGYPEFFDFRSQYVHEGATEEYEDYEAPKRPVEASPTKQNTQVESID